MKIVILYHPEYEFARSVEEFARDFERRKGQALTLVSLETKEGAQMARLYDITVYPAILAIKDDNQLVKEWQGLPLPLMEEVVLV